MPMSRQAKEDMVQTLSGKLADARAGLVIGFEGLDVASVSQIRTKFREIGAEYKVVKNTLMKRALTGTAVEGLSEAFSGAVAVALKFDDEAGQLGKAAKDLQKSFEKFNVKAGYVGEDLLDGDVVEKMSKIPTLDEARAMLLGVLNAPAEKLLAQINAPGQQLVGVIKAKEEKDKESAEGGSCVYDGA